MASPDRHRRSQEIFLAARDLPADARERYLRLACGEDAELRREIEALLEHDAQPRNNLDRALEADAGRLPLRECVDALLDDVRSDAERLVAPAEGSEQPERTIGKFHIRRQIGEGGMGVVYEAEQEHPRRTVALKILRGTQLSPQALRRFERECEFLGRLQHPGIAQVFESGRAETPQGPVPYLAMELVRGEPLLEYARRHALGIPARMELLARVADAVQHAHQNGVIHRDLKPSNILVDESGTPKVLDFGIARTSDSDLRISSMHTDLGQILGTLSYMSPEQASGDPAAIDTRSDVYSLGVLLYELLTDRLPYDVSQKLLHEAVRVIREEVPLRMSAATRSLGRDVETLVSKALEKEKERRYGSARELAEDIRRHLRDEPILARPASGLYLAQKFVRRHKTLVLATALVLASLVTGLVFALHFGLREAEERRKAEREAYRANLAMVTRHLRDRSFPAGRAIHERIPERLRGWEWHHLARGWVSELARISLGEVFGAAFLREGEVLTVGRFAQLQAWDPATGELSSRSGWCEGKLAVALREDGSRILVYDAGELLLGDPLGVAPTVSIRFPEGPPKVSRRHAAIAADGERVVVTTSSEEILLIDMSSGTRTAIDDGKGAVHQVSFSPGGGRLATNREGRVRVWDTRRVDLLHSTARVMAFAPDDASMVVETNTPHGAGAGLYFKDAETGVTMRRLGRESYGVFHTLECSDLRYSADQRILAVAFADQEARIVEADAGLPWPLPDPLPVHPGSGLVGSLLHEGVGPLLLSFDREGARLLSFRPEDGTLRVWHTRGDVVPRLREEEMNYVLAVAFHPDGSMLASTGADGGVRVWDAVLHRQVQRLPVPYTGKSLAYSPDGRLLACGTVRSLVLFDAFTGRSRASLPTAAVSALAFSPDGRTLAGALSDSKIHFWDAHSMQERAPLEVVKEPISLAFSADGRWIAAGFRGGDLRLWEVGTGKLLASLLVSDAGRTHFPGARAVAFSPDGHELAVGWGNSKITQHRVPSLELTRELRESRGEVFSVAYSPDGSRLASGGRDSMLRIWDTESGSLLLQREAHGDYVMALAFDAEGRRIVTASGDKSLRLWDSAPIGQSWAEHRTSLRAEPEARRLIAELYEELNDSDAVWQRLERMVNLSPTTQRMSRLELLRRASQAPR